MGVGKRRRAEQAERRRKVVILSGIGTVLAALVIYAFVALWSGTGATPSSAYTVATGSNTTGPAGLAIGAPFPDFTMTEVSGRTITNASLLNMPTLIWFTTSYCVPCQVGARRVAQLEDAMGPGALNVVVVFVDPKESPGDLQRWRQQFGKPDWQVGFDNGLAIRVQLQYLDTKYLLDRKGVVQDSNVNIADDAYLARIRQIVQSP